MNRIASHLRPLPLQSFLFGSCYYPEHWDAETRALDPKRMKDAGWNTVRMGEFAWDYFEPKQGHFEFSLFDETIAQMGDLGIKTILGTPTAAPPRWLTLQHPEILRVDVNGSRQEHGSRQHASHFSGVFRNACKRITEALAVHYADNPHVIGWQTDNELHCHFSEDYSDAAQEMFSHFLQERYQDDIRALNTAWGSVFWAQTYERFEDVPLPRPGKPTYVNPSHHLDYFRFLSWGAKHFQRDQVEILRRENAAWFIFHNGTYAAIDYRHDLAPDLDFMGYDTYPLFTNDVKRRARDHAFYLDRTRSHAGNFFVPEHQSGAGGQEPYLHDTPEPGEMRRMTWTSIAHGADGILYFRWRSCRFGAEIYWHGILDHDNVPRRRLQEAKDVASELAQSGEAILGTSVRADVGLALDDFVSGYAHRALSLGLPDASVISQNIHGFFWTKGYLTACAHPDDDLSGFKVYFLPHLVTFDPSWLPTLQNYVEQGGILVVGARTGCRDLNNQALADSLPGPLRDLCGVTVEEYGRQNCPEQRPLVLDLKNETVITKEWYEILDPQQGTEVLATWTTRHMAGRAAITMRNVGKGAVLYVGTYFTPEIVELLGAALIEQSGLRRPFPERPESVEVVHRSKEGSDLWFFLNHGDVSAVVNTVPPGLDILSGMPFPGGSLYLDPDRVKVLNLKIEN